MRTQRDKTSRPLITHRIYATAAQNMQYAHPANGHDVNDGASNAHHRRHRHTAE